MKFVRAEFIDRAIMGTGERLAKAKEMVTDCIEAGAHSSALVALVEAAALERALEILQGLPQEDDQKIY